MRLTAISEITKFRISNSTVMAREKLLYRVIRKTIWSRYPESKECITAFQNSE